VLGALGLVLNCITLWNTVYLNDALDTLRAQGYPVLGDDVARLSPFVRRHLNSTATTRSTCPSCAAAAARCATPTPPTKT
jgi:hypothetical protein